MLVSMAVVLAWAGWIGWREWPRWRAVREMRAAVEANEPGRFLDAIEQVDSLGVAEAAADEIASLGQHPDPRVRIYAVMARTVLGPRGPAEAKEVIELFDHPDGLIAIPARAQKAVELFEETSFDFGTVARGQNLKHTFKITNNFDKRLHMMRASPLEGALRVSKLEKQWLDPGESIGLEVNWNTRSFTRKKSVPIYVEFDRPSYRRVELLVSTDVRSDIVVNPGQIAFGDVPKGKVSTRTIAIEYAGDPAWKIASASCKSRHLDIQLEEKHREIAEKGSATIAKGCATVGYELRVSLRPDAPAGLIDDRVVLEIMTHTVSPITLLVTGNIVEEPSTGVARP